MALLTPTELRTAITTSLTDERLQELLDATEADITAAAGATDAQTEHAAGGHAALVLTRPIGSITSVTERADTSSTLVLSSDDYRIDGYMLKRLDTGTNPRLYWDGLVKVVHDPSDRLAERKRAQVALVRLDMNTAAGLTSERIGDYAAGFGNTAGGTDYQEARQLILDSLKPLMVA